MILREYQENGVNACRREFAKGHRSVLYVLPTGAGKTVLFSRIAQLSSSKGARIGILVHRDSLLTQASDKLLEFNVKHGIIAPGHKNYGDTVNVASVQTLVRRLDKYDFNILIADEGHHGVAPSWVKIMAAYPKAKILGVTATPCDSRGRGLSHIYQSLVTGPSIGELIRDGYLVEPVTYGPKHFVDLTKLEVRGGDYVREQIAELMDTPKITGDAIERYSQVCPGVPAMIFCCNIKHTEDVARDFRAAGYRAKAIHGQLPLTEIRESIAALGTGEIQLLASCDLVSEGTDIPAAVCAISLRLTKSLLIHIQQSGRVLRPVYAPGFDLSTRDGRLAAIARGPKPKAIILDHAANCFAKDANGDFFMTVDEHRDWTLEGIKKRKAGSGKKSMTLSQCPECLRPHKPARLCPFCGHIYVSQTELPTTTEGELVPIDKRAMRRLKFTEEYACKTIEELKEVGKRRGYKPAWAYIRWDIMHPEKGPSPKPEEIVFK